MTTLDRASQVLHETEGKLRDLLAEAASSGDYGSVVQIAAWARSLVELVNGHTAKSKTNVSPRAKSATKNGKARKESSTANRPSHRNPQFFRQGDQLLRLAWSKREKRKYCHKAPHDILKVLATAIAEQGADGRVFTTEQLLPIHDRVDGAVPNYQAYVGISLLKHTGLIEQHGRQGYSIPRPTNFVEAVESVWKKLPQSSNQGAILS